MIEICSHSVITDDDHYYFFSLEQHRRVDDSLEQHRSFAMWLLHSDYLVTTLTGLMHFSLCLCHPCARARAALLSRVQCPCTMGFRTRGAKP